MFSHKDYIVFHDLDRCTSFHARQEVCVSSTRSKPEDALTDPYSMTWVAHHGSFETLYVDGESGLTNPNAKTKLPRLGTKVQARAPEQHVRFQERRGRTLRLCFHKAADQCAREGFRINYKSLVAECIFMCNALIVGGISSYQDVDGYIPTLLRNFAMTADEPNGTQQQCIRTISIDVMMNYNPDDMVDMWQRASSKDVFSCREPHAVVGVVAEDV